MLAAIGVSGVIVGVVAWASSAILSRRVSKQVVLPPLDRELQERCVDLLGEGERTEAIRVLVQESGFSLKAASSATDHLSGGSFLPSTWEEVIGRLHNTTSDDVNQRVGEGDMAGAQKILARRTTLGLVEGRDLVRSIES